MTEKLTVLFTADTEPHQGEIHKEGDTQEMSRASAERWIRRGKAVIATAVKPKAPPKKKAAKAG